MMGLSGCTRAPLHPHRQVSTGVALRSFEGHGGTVMSVCVSPCGGHLFTGSHDWKAKMWDVQTGAELRSFEGHDDDVCAVQM